MKEIRKSSSQITGTPSSSQHVEEGNKPQLLCGPYWRNIFRKSNVTVSKQKICIAYSHVHSSLSENLLYKELRKHPKGRELTTLWDVCFRVLAASRPQLHERNCDL